MAQTADELGYETVRLPDHWLRAPPSQGILFECWTVAAALARDTKWVRLGQLVTLKLMAYSGDACHLISGPATLEHKFAVLKQHCKAVERDDTAFIGRP